MNQYEVAVLFHPDLEMDIDKAYAKVEKIIADNGGKVLAKDAWGKRKLAYPIAKQESAIYVFYMIDLPAEATAKVEAALNITSEVIRYLIVKPDLKAKAKAEKRQQEKVAKAEKSAAHAAKKEAKEEE